MAAPRSDFDDGDLNLPVVAFAPCLDRRGSPALMRQTLFPLIHSTYRSFRVLRYQFIVLARLAPALHYPSHYQLLQLLSIDPIDRWM